MLNKLQTNRLRLRAHVLVVRLLALQGIPFRGHDEKSSSSNRGNFLNFELRLKNVIREEIGVAKYCIIVDEAVMSQKKSKCLFVLRFVDTNGFIQEKSIIVKFYAQDFTSEEKESLKMQLKHYEHNVVKGWSDFKNSFNAISELGQWLVKTNKSATYDLIFRVIVLVLTLPVSTATAERSFSAMNIVKTRLRSKMEDAFLSDALMVFIEREIAKSLSIDDIIEDFKNFKERRIPFS
ncbi:uncharacterized protein LOC109830977 [Asparagus officinalis]|uniref:uncharacterized protein LOC109830977 n=1 Tax=Asparagus officinalis TaxID=4686 RepID=UPI00098E8520|nr:uncharacterized protein LOC109830977 [Asparagus officinalis]